MDRIDPDANSTAQPRDESFVGRWSRRKRAEPEKRTVEDTQVAHEQEQQRAADVAARAPVAPAPVTAPADLPAIDTLTPESDYSRFMQADVPLASRNAAMKKLFTDPHFNVMDGLDTYIDDYTKFDPIPESMLRGLAQSRMLKLFDYSKEEAEEEAERVRLRAQVVAEQEGVAGNAAPATADHIADTGSAGASPLLAGGDAGMLVEPNSASLQVAIDASVAIAAAVTEPNSSLTPKP